MDPYSHPPFLGPLHIVLEIDWKQLTKLAPDCEQYSIRSPALPTKARFAGFSFGERFVAFDQKTPTQWTATVSLDREHLTSGVGPKQPPAPKEPAAKNQPSAAKNVPAEPVPAPAHGSRECELLFSAGVGASNPPAGRLPAGEVEAPFYFGKPIGDDVFRLSIDVQGRALPAIVTGTPLTSATFKGDVTLVIATDGAGPFTVPFAAGKHTAAAVVAAIQAQTKADPADPMVCLNASSEIVLTSLHTGSSAYVDVSGAAAGALGLPTGYTYGTDGGALPAEAIGTQDLTKLTYPIAGTLTLGTDDRATFTVTFGAGVTSPEGVVTAIANTDPNADPVASVDGNRHLVLRSRSKGQNASLTIGGTAAGTLGLPVPTGQATTVTLPGTAAPGLGAATSGRIDGHLFYFVERGL
jgi:hypothetical protein